MDHNVFLCLLLSSVLVEELCAVPPSTSPCIWVFLEIYSSCFRALTGRYACLLQTLEILLGLTARLT